VRKQSKPEEVGDLFEQDMSFFKLLSEKADVLTKHYFYLFRFSQEIQQVVIEHLLFQSEIIEKTFEDDEVLECLQNISSLLFGITVDNVHNTLFTFLKIAILICFVRQQGYRFLEKVGECCTDRKSLLNVVRKNNSQKANPMTLKMLRLVAIEGLYHMSMVSLQRNKAVLLSQMKKNPSKLDPKIVKIHKTKIESLIGDNWSPNEGLGPEQDFKHTEHWVGHDLFVK
jgi:hypothetical protein